MENNIGIYLYTNVHTCKVYVGQSNNLHRRHNEFRWFGLYKYAGTKINNARKKYNHIEDWDYKILVYCSEEELDFYELYYIGVYDAIRSGYNQLLGGHDNKGKNNPMYGRKQSEHSKQVNSEWHKAKMKGENNPMYGRKQSDKSNTQNKMSQPNRQAVIKYDMNMNVVGVYNSLRDAAKSIGKSNKCISLCCRGKQDYAYGFIWKYKKESA